MNDETIRTIITFCLGVITAIGAPYIASRQAQRSEELSWSEKYEHALSEIHKLNLEILDLKKQLHDLETVVGSETTEAV